MLLPGGLSWSPDLKQERQSLAFQTHFIGARIVGMHSRVTNSGGNIYIFTFNSQPIVGFDEALRSIAWAIKFIRSGQLHNFRATISSGTRRLAESYPACHPRCFSSKARR